MAAPVLVKTRIDLINQALSVLGVLAAGQAASPEDFDEIDDHIDPLLASLERRDIITVDDTDQIPAEWFLPLAVLLADAAADAFGLPGVPATQGNPNPAAGAIQELREITYGRPTYELQRGEYF